jgi:antitoxin YefM
MSVTNITNARKKLYALVESVNISHEPVVITSKKGSVVMIAQEDWKSIEETLYLSSMPGMKKSIIKGLKEPLSKCTDTLNW